MGLKNTFESPLDSKEIKPDSFWPYGLQYTRLPPYALLNLPKSESEVPQLRRTLCDAMDCSLSGSSVHGIFQARGLEWVAISISTGSSRSRDRTQISHIAGRHFTVWTTHLPAPAAVKSLQSCLTLWDAIDGSPPGPSVPGILQARTLEWVAISFSTNLLKFAQIYVHWVDDTIQHSHCLPPSFSSCPQSFPAIWIFSNESTLCIRWPKYWSFSFSIIPSNEYSGLISFRMDWLDLLAVQGTLKSFLQYHNLKASIHWCSAFFMVQLSHPYMTTGKIIVLTRPMSTEWCLFFNTLSRCVITFLPRSKCFLIYGCSHHPKWF